MWAWALLSLINIKQNQYGLSWVGLGLIKFKQELDLKKK